MKKYLVFLFLISLKLQATTYYIATAEHNGSNANNGTLSSPWLTLSYACIKVSGVGDTIYITSGKYTETSQCVLAPGVSIIGEGYGSHIISHYDSGSESFNNALIYMVSSTEGSEGNQSISYIFMDGDGYSGRRAIYCRYRNNVSIHHCTIINFRKSGINFYSETNWIVPPTNYSTACRIYGNLISNCTENPDNGAECNLRIAGYENVDINNNIIINNLRIAGRSIYTSQLKNCSIYKNAFYCRKDVQNYWNFAMELFNPRGGLEVYENTIYGGGCIDVAGHSIEKGAYRFAASVHDNYHILENPVVYDDNIVTAITIEAWKSIESVYVYNNYIKNFPWGISCTMGSYSKWGGGGTIDDLYIYNNVIENPSHSDKAMSSFGIAVLRQTDANYRKNINIWNNTIIGNAPYAWRGILYQVTGKNNNISIKNNIIQGFTRYGIRIENYGGIIDGLYVNNNLIHDCGNRNKVSFEAVKSCVNYTNLNHLTSDPLLTSSSDFYLSSGSPAIRAGSSVGLLTDHVGKKWDNPPSIGAFEYDKDFRIHDKNYKKKE
jgi:hypothetical protein